jgi:hypothetical protein
MRLHEPQSVVVAESNHELGGEIIAILSADRRMMTTFA